MAAHIAGLDYRPYENWINYIAWLSTIMIVVSLLPFIGVVASGFMVPIALTWIAAVAAGLTITYYLDD